MQSDVLHCFCNTFTKITTEVWQRIIKWKNILFVIIFFMFHVQLCLEKSWKKTLFLQKLRFVWPPEPDGPYELGAFPILQVLSWDEN